MLSNAYEVDYCFSCKCGSLIYFPIRRTLAISLLTKVTKMKKRIRFFSFCLDVRFKFDGICQFENAKKEPEISTKQNFFQNIRIQAIFIQILVSSCLIRKYQESKIINNKIIMQIQTKTPQSQKQRSKHPPKYKITNIKLASLPFQKPRDFSLRSAPSMEEYNPLKDRYLQQFFRRQTRVKLLNIFSTQKSVESKTVIQRIKTEAKDKSKSSYQNLMRKECVNSKTYLDPNKKESQNVIISLQQIAQEKRIATEHPITYRQNNSVNISKQQFRKFLQKARQRLKLSPQTKI